MYTNIYIYTLTEMSHDSFIRVMTHEPITRMQASVHTTAQRKRIQTNKYMYIYMYTYKYVYIYIYTYICIYRYIHTRTYIYIHMCIYIHM